MAFPAIRKRVQNRLETTIFRRGDPGRALGEIRACLEDNEGGEESLDRVGEVMARFANAERWQVVEDGTGTGKKLIRARIRPDRESDGRSRRHRWAEVEVPIRTSGEETRCLLLGRRRGGHRYLSRDLEDLDRLSTELSDQLERRRRTELNRLVAEAELDTLRAQINPHFLFNSLNALYATIPRSAVDARETLVNLAEIFRYSLQGNRQFVSLDQEMRIVQAYLQIERLRLGKRLRTGIDIAEDTWQIAVPVLSIQPLVENAVKHGVEHRDRSGNGSDRIPNRRRDVAGGRLGQRSRVPFRRSAGRRPGSGERAAAAPPLLWRTGETEDRFTRHGGGSRIESAGHAGSAAGPGSGRPPWDVDAAIRSRVTQRSPVRNCSAR